MLSVFSNIFDLNQSILPGAMDVIVVKQKDGSFKSTPFHVRFGSLKAVKKKDKIISLSVNDAKIPVQMKLSSGGDAYFLFEEEENYSRSFIENEDSDSIYSEVSNKKKSDKHLRLSKEFTKQHVNVFTLDHRSLDEERNRSYSSPSYGKTDPSILESKTQLQSRTKQVKIQIASKSKSSSVVTTKSIIDYKDDVCDVPIEEDAVSVSSKINNYSGKDKKRRLTDLLGLNEFQEKNSLKIPERVNTKCEISLALDEMTNDPTKFEEIFESKKIDEATFKKDYATLVTNPNLAIKIDNKIYPFKAGEYVLLSKILYGKDPDKTDLEKYLTASKSGLFGNLRSKIKLPVFEIKELKKIKYKPRLSNLDLLKESAKKKEKLKDNKPGNVPTSYQLQLMNLKPGKNTITFKCHSTLTGTKKLSCSIFLWNYNDKIVISDVDGTITKSDVMGHIMPILGKDWTHDGVSRLFNLIAKNGYKIIYLTARALCQVNMTKDYLRSVKQGKSTYINFRWTQTTRRTFINEL